MNKEEKKEYDKLYYKRNREKLLEKQKEYDKLNKEKIKEYRNNNEEKLFKYKKDYYQNNKEYFKEYNKEYKRNYKEKRNQKQKEKRKTNHLYKLSVNIRNNIYGSLKRNNYKKKSKTYEILGCDFDFFKNYIESKFEHWMDWQNYGKYNGEFNYGWDFDHIIPISSATTESEILKLNHYTNFQPLCSKINRDIKINKL